MESDTKDKASRMDDNVKNTESPVRVRRNSLPRRGSFSVPTAPPSQIPFGLSEMTVIISLGVLVLVLLLYILMGRSPALLPAPAVTASEDMETVRQAIVQLQEGMTRNQALSLKMAEMLEALAKK